eukprot:TRINITY_DN2647_c0_g1_i1.p1 TRINITY_DN2647_c0_g1~~TRINITY_DN2647_c0_g1_i1.p1  ORF type:complete len:482 (-),score=130.11 TRINITY_DN2647_c0_g1_i1:197-1642(-)
MGIDLKHAMSGEKVRLLTLIRPALALVPEVEKPRGKYQFREKVIWTGVTLFLYLICCQIPLYGVARASGSDPFYWMRVILASNRGTLMELGISPIVTSSMVMQFLGNARIIDVDMKVKEDRNLLKGAEKLLSLIICVCEAFAYVWSGMYGDISQLGAGNALLIVMQLSFAGIVVIMLDEMMDKGYGLGSGISLFIATNICENIIWRAFSPITIRRENETEFEGAIIALVHFLLTKQNKVSAIHQAFYRSNSPNINNLLATVFVFLIVIYFQGFKVELKMSNHKVRGYEQTYPIKLFYTSNIPIILQTALVSNLYFLSQIFYKRFKTNFLVRLLGVWQELEYGGQSIPVSGIAYYISPPRDWQDIVADPFHAVVYSIFVLGICALFSRLWLAVSGQAPEDVAKQLKDQQMFFTGHREESMISQLRRYIPTAAALGGMCIGILTIISDFMGAIGSGTGILLAVNIIYGYCEMFQKQRDDISFD